MTLDERVAEVEKWVKIFTIWAIAISIVFLWGTTAHCKDKQKGKNYVSARKSPAKNL